MTEAEKRKMTKKKRVLTILILAILAPLVVVAEYFFILTFTLPYSDIITTENDVFFLSLVGGGLTLISLYLFIRTIKKEKLFAIKKALPMITTTALSIALWTLFVTWMVFKELPSFNLSTFMGTLILAIPLVGSSTWETIRTFREGRKIK